MSKNLQYNIEGFPVITVSHLVEQHKKNSNHAIRKAAIQQPCQAGNMAGWSETVRNSRKQEVGTGDNLAAM